MYLDAERHSGPVWTTTTSDPRITPLGRFLRATHLDELPQLINVVAGEMALVGPRPERPEFAQVLAEEIPGYLDRLHVLPGVTGLAQLNLPPDTDVESVRRKLLLDLQYIGQASLGYDFRLLLATAAPLLGIRASAANRLLRVCAGGKLAQAETLVQRPVKLSDEHDEIIRAMTVRT
jgi:lipopolysaccharide/colanic/teichoic acid biosynthesis glycosyltransferase